MTRELDFGAVILMGNNLVSLAGDFYRLRLFITCPKKKKARQSGFCSVSPENAGIPHLGVPFQDEEPCPALAFVGKEEAEIPKTEECLAPLWVGTAR